MSANNALHIAVLGGDGIGPEVMAPALEVLRKIEATTDLKFRFSRVMAAVHGRMVRDARRCRAPHHEGLRPHPEERAFARVSKEEAN